MPARLVTNRSAEMGAIAKGGSGSSPPAVSGSGRLEALQSLAERSTRVKQLRGLAQLANERERDAGALRESKGASATRQRALASRHAERAPVQRKPEPYREADKALSDYVDLLDKLTEDAATRLVIIENVPSDGGGYFDRWSELASAFLTEKEEPPFLYTSFGYAVEKDVTLKIAAANSKLPQGWTVQTQVAHGTTRPDIVVLDNTGSERAWIDITSKPGHIKQKVGGGWDSRDYVYEILYPSLDPKNIAASGGMYEGIKARSAYKQYEQKKERALASFRDNLTSLVGQPDTMPETRKAFITAFQEELSHDTIRSLIELAGQELEDFGYFRGKKIGRNKSAALALIFRHYYK